MKIIISNNIPEDNNFHPLEEGWKQLKEPKNIVVTMLISVPLGILMASIVIAFAQSFGIKSNIDLNFSALIALIIIVPIHELIHALTFPDSIKSDKVMFGMLPKVGAFYAHYEGQMTKIRFVLMLINPIIILTLIPLSILCVMHINIPFIIKISALNALCGCVDILSSFMIIFQVPKNSLVRNKGIKTYWK